MAIVIYVSDEYFGYGDFLYGLRLSAGLKKKLRQIGSQEKIYLVSQQSGKDKIHDLKGDEEFGVDVLSIEELQVLQAAPDFQMTCFIEAAVFDPFTYERLNIHPDTPILLLPEYSLSVEAYRSADQRENVFRWRKVVIESGYGINDNSRGIFVDEDLTACRDDSTKKANFWQELDPTHRETILGDSQVENYNENTELSFEYSHDDKRGKLFQDSSCEHFLRVHSLYYGKSPKNQDIVSVGNNTKAKKNALRNMLDELKKNGFGKIIYINLQTGEEKVFFDDRAPNQKVYRLLYTKQLSHRQMIAMQALSGDICGSTGDQSFGEAISAGKILVYECISHKRSFAFNFIKELYRISQNKQVRALAKMLLIASVDSIYLDKRDRKKLRSLLHNPAVITAYKEACKQLLTEKNYIDAVMDELNLIISHEPSQDNEKNSIAIFAAIHQNNQEKVRLLLESNPSLLATVTSHHITPLTYALSLKNKEMVNFLTEFGLAHREQLRLAFTQRDTLKKMGMSYLDDSYYDDNPRTYDILVLQNVLNRYAAIFEYNPLKNLKHHDQIAFLKRILSLADTTWDDFQMAKRAAVGALLLVRKSIRAESYIWHGSDLLKKVENALFQLGFKDLDEISQNPIFFNALKNFIKDDTELLQNKTFIQDFSEQTSSSIDSTSVIPGKPSDLNEEQIAVYQHILSKLSSNHKIIKIDNKNPKLKRRGLPYSVLKYPGDRGFYILDTGDGSIIGQGGWGKVKNGYYCDENGRIDPTPLVIKIEDTSNIDSARKELFFFSTVHPREEQHLYQTGVRQDKKKRYSILPKLPGRQLDLYLRENPEMSLHDKLKMIKAIAVALQEMHIHHIAHLDLKAKSILYDPNEEKAYLIDFGYAKTFNTWFTSQDHGMSEYMPPEIFQGASINASIDIYSCVALIAQILGVPLLDLLSRKLENALQKIRSPNNVRLIRETFEENSNINLFGETIYSLPEKCYRDSGFSKFLIAYSSTSDYDFSAIERLYPEIVELLNPLLIKMSAENPDERPSILEIINEIDSITRCLQYPQSSH